MSTKPSDWLKGALLLILTGLIAFGVIERQAVGDYIKLATYRAPANVSQLAADDTMTAKARHLFYINRPQVESKAAFREDCPNGTEQTVVLGCYHGGESGIYLLGVSDPRLNGVEQVTAAHEMLHAAYERLSSAERARVDNWLVAYYKTVTDPALRQTIDAYKKSEPGSVVNEMHSIFGTEVAKLPPPLENYYKQYFSDRSKITGYYAGYQATFTNLRQQIAGYDQQLSALKARITEDETGAESQSASLTQQREQLEAERGNGNAGAYNAAVSSYNENVNSYNALVVQIRSEINRYNQIVNQRNQIAIAVDNLGQELDANVQTAPAPD